MEKLFVIVFDNELEFDELADKIGNRFINSDNAIEYCGSWGKIMFNNLILAKSIFSDFNPMAFVDNLKYMLSGMIAIFIVIGIIVLITIILNKIFSKK